MERKEKNTSSSYKEKLAIWTSIISFALGWILTVVNFIVSPIGEVSNGTLWILGQSLLYVGSVIGITSYVNKEMDAIRKTIK